MIDNDKIKQPVEQEKYCNQKGGSQRKRNDIHTAIITPTISVAIRNYSPSLKPSQIPIIPPIAEPMTPDIENKLLSQRDGINPPRVEPTAKKIQISLLRSIKKL